MGLKMEYIPVMPVMAILSGPVMTMMWASLARMAAGGEVPADLKSVGRAQFLHGGRADAGTMVK